VERGWATLYLSNSLPMTPRPFGQLPSGESVEAYTLANAAGASVEVLTYGGIVRSLRVPDRGGRIADVVLGFDTLEGYLGGRAYYGAIIGRIAGRVTAGRIWLQGRGYSLALNDGANHLHGGRRGLDRRIWAAEPIPHANGDSSLRLSYLSPDGEEGYPGNVAISVTYTLTAGNSFVIETAATADQVTPLSLTHHSYFNLAGEGSGDISGHEFQFFADEYVPSGDAFTLSDLRERVAGSGADFRRPRLLKEALPGLSGGHGDNYLLRGPGAPRNEVPTLAARVTEGRSGRTLEVFTDESCLQFYTGGALGDAAAGKSGRAYGPRSGFCLECQGYPNATSIATFGDILVAPGTPQSRRTVYAFSAS
jgi:aldose 1-epimerase